MIISDRAWKRIAEVQREAETFDPVRISIRGGGCSGFEYAFGFDVAADDDTTIYGPEGQAVIIDAHSILYLDAAELDFKSDLYSSNFVFRNPNATNTCGCGNSFSV